MPAGIVDIQAEIAQLQASIQDLLETLALAQSNPNPDLSLIGEIIDAINQRRARLQELQEQLAALLAAQGQGVPSPNQEAAAGAGLGPPNPGNVIISNVPAGATGNEIVSHFDGLPLGNWIESVPPFCFTENYGERYDNDGEQVATVEFLTPWLARNQFVQSVLGYSTAFKAQGSSARIVRVPPMQHAEKPWLYAHSCELVRPEGFAYERPLAFYDPLTRQLSPRQAPWFGIARNEGGSYFDGVARMRVTFRPLPYEIRTDQEMERTGRGEICRWTESKNTYTISALNLPADFRATLMFVGGTTPVPSEGLFAPLPGQQIRYVWHQVPDVPWGSIDACVGKVNDKEFDKGNVALGLKDQGFSPGTLLCQAPLVQRIPRSVAGRVMWRIEYVFDYKPNGWNFFMNSSGNFVEASVGGTVNGERLFKPADFKRLWSIPDPRVYQ